jgi:hypothetical protein
MTNNHKKSPKNKPILWAFFNIAMPATAKATATSTSTSYLISSLLYSFLNFFSFGLFLAAGGSLAFMSGFSKQSNS